jgi:propionyl-CoA carboxylase beta chain
LADRLGGANAWITIAAATMRQRIPETREEKRALLEQRRRDAVNSGSAAAVDKQHAEGKLTARERIDRLLDPGSFQELDMFVRHRTHDFDMQDARPWGDAVVTGHGLVDGRPLCVFSQDFTVSGGSFGEVMGEKIVKVMDLAARIGCPVVGIYDSRGARIQDGMVSLAAYGEVFVRNVRASGVIPQISLIMGPCIGSAVYSPAITDFVFMVNQTSHMFVTGPDAIRTVTSEEVDFESLGGAMAHSSKSGVAHFIADHEDQCLEDARYLLSFLPQNNLETPPRVQPADDPDRMEESLDRIIPDNPRRGYDMRDVVSLIVDDGEFLEVQEHFARNMICGFARLDGAAVCVIGDQPSVMSGVLDSDACCKAARFVRFCDAFNLPIISFCDVPGLLPGTREEWGGIIRHGAKLVFALAEATVPRICLTTRKAYGGAYMMGGRNLQADMCFAWPQADIAVMGPEAAVNVIYRRQLSQAEDPAKLRTQLLEDYRARFSGPWSAAERGWLEDVIEPRASRPRLIQALRALPDKRLKTLTRRHENIPL